jgi:autotransporter-associated beta strand protein
MIWLGSWNIANSDVGTWKRNSGGNWSAAENWNGGIPNGPGDVAIIGPIRPTQPAAIELAGPITLGELQLLNRSQTLVGGSIVFDSGNDEPAFIYATHSQMIIQSLVGAANKEDVIVDAQNLWLSNHLPDADSGRLIKRGSGILVFDGQNPGWSGPVVLETGSLNVESPSRFGSLVIDGERGRFMFVNNSQLTMNGVADVRSGELVLSQKGELQSVPEIVLGRTGSLILRNRIDEQSTPMSNRLASNPTIRLQGGTFRLNVDEQAPVSEKIDRLIADRGSSVFSLDSRGDQSLIEARRLERVGNATLELTSNANVLIGGPARLKFTEPPSLRYGMLEAWLVDNGSFLAYNENAGVLNLYRTVTPALQIQGATELAHIRTTERQTPLTRDHSIASLRTEFDVPIDLGGNELNIASGGWISVEGGHIFNGRLTAGGDSAGELVLHNYRQTRDRMLVVDASIVDNRNGSVALTINAEGLARLSGANTYTGSTTVNSGSILVTSSQSIPKNTPLNLDGGFYFLDFDTPQAIDLGVVRISQNGILETNSGRRVSVNADEYLLQHGKLATTLSGTGRIEKTSPGLVELAGDNRDFSGTIDVRQGLLLAGSLSLAVPSSALGTGQVNVHTGGTLVNGASVVGNIRLEGGELALTNLTRAGWNFDGQIHVSRDSRINFHDAIRRAGMPPADVSLDAHVSFEPSTRLTLGGPGRFRFNRLHVNRQSTIDIREGSVNFGGLLVAAGLDSSLDLVGAGAVTLEGSVEIPRETSLKFLRNGTPIELQVKSGGQSVAGDGRLDSKLFVARGGYVQPGKDGAGTLTVSERITFGKLGIYDWELADLADNPVQTDFDRLITEQDLVIGSTVSEPFVIRVLGKASTGAVGRVAGFDPNLEHRWTIASAARPLADFDARLFRVDATSFTQFNPIQPGATFFVDAIGTELQLVYDLLSTLGDFNNNNQLDVNDIDLLTRAILQGDQNPIYDLNDDGLIDQRDRFAWVKDVRKTFFGDANLNGQFESSDLVQVFTAGLYEDGIPLNATWATGDWNGDGDFGTSDLVTAFSDGRNIVANGVPEPSSGIGLIACLFGIVIRRGRISRGVTASRCDMRRSIRRVGRQLRRLTISMSVLGIAAVSTNGFAAVKAVSYNGVSFPSGNESFVDVVLRFDPLFNGGPGPRNPVPQNVIGPPKFSGVSLGKGGLIELGFSDYLLSNSGDELADLFILEATGTPETMLVSVRPLPEIAERLDPALDADRDGYFDLGPITVAANLRYATFDIDKVFPGIPENNLAFDAIRLIDDPRSGSTTGDTVGADLESVGAIFAIPFVPVIGDFDADRKLTPLDIERLSAEVRSRNHEEAFDLNLDHLVNQEDRRVWVEDVRRTYFGDSNLDGEFNSGDLVAVFQVGEYEDTIGLNSTWADGDWSGDSEFNSADFVLSFQTGGFEAGPRTTQPNNVPEPSCMLVISTVWLTSIAKHRWPRGDFRRRLLSK